MKVRGEKVELDLGSDTLVVRDALHADRAPVAIPISSIVDVQFHPATQLTQGRLSLLFDNGKDFHAEFRKPDSDAFLTLSSLLRDRIPERHAWAGTPPPAPRDGAIAGNTGLKVLIAAACLAVLARVGYFFWGEWQDYRRRVEIEESREGARDELFRLAGAKQYEIDKVRMFCKGMSDKRYREDDNSEFVRILVRNCSALGYD